MGRRLCDFVWVSGVPVICARVVDLLLANEVRGWTTYPVRVFDRKGVEALGYSGLSVTGRCESICFDRGRAEVVYKDLPGGRFPFYKGLSVTTDSWDGSDIFTCADMKTGFVVVTPKVRDLCRDARITNVEFQSITDVLDPETAHL